MKVKDLLSSPDNWIKGDFVQNAKNETVHSVDEGAVKFCLVGAIDHCYQKYEDAIVVRKKIRNSIVKLYPQFVHKIHKGVSVLWFNDSNDTSYKDIMKVVEDADV